MMRSSTEITLEGVGRLNIRNRREDVVDGLKVREVSLSAHYTNDEDGMLYDEGDCNHITIAFHAVVDEAEDDQPFSTSLDYRFAREEAALLRDWLNFALEHWHG